MPRIRSMLTFLRAAVTATAVLCAHHGSAMDANLAGKSITIIVPSNAGGGSDSMGRLLGRYLHDYLPGKPSVVVQNIPGAGGIKAVNFFVQRIKPDGLTSIAGSAS